MILSGEFCESILWIVPRSMLDFGLMFLEFFDMNAIVQLSVDRIFECVQAHSASKAYWGSAKRVPCVGNEHRVLITKLIDEEIDKLVARLPQLVLDCVADGEMRTLSVVTGSGVPAMVLRRQMELVIVDGVLAHLWEEHKAGSGGFLREDAERVMEGMRNVFMPGRIAPGA